MAICFSFGNNLRCYCYSTKIENLKKALHFAICFNDFSLLESLGVKINNNLYGRIEITKQVKALLKLNRLEIQNLEALNRLESLERLQSLESLERLQSLDYKKIRIKSNSVIYCDPPYKDTAKYTIDFNHEEFYMWCKKQKHLTIISEYQMPNDFICIASKDKRVILSDNSLLKNEKLFIPKHQKDLYLEMTKQ